MSEEILKTAIESLKLQLQLEKARTARLEQELDRRDRAIAYYVSGKNDQAIQAMKKGKKK